MCIPRKEVRYTSLLPPQLRCALPPLRATEHERDPLVIYKLFADTRDWAWYVIKCDGQDTCFGLVQADTTGFSYFSLEELRVVGPLLGVTVKRDEAFTPRKLSEVWPCWPSVRQTLQRMRQERRS